MLLAVADQVGTAHGLERLAQQRPVVRVVIAQESLVQAAPALALHHVHHFRAIGIRAIRAVHALERVHARVVHRRGRGHGAGIEGLHLIRAEAVALEPEGQGQHVLVAGAGVGGDEVGDQVLLLAGLAREAVEQLLEAVIGADAPLPHL